MDVSTPSAPSSGAQTTAPTQTSGAQTQTSTQTQNASSGAKSTGSQTQSQTSQSAPEYFELKVNGKTMRMTREEVLANAQLGLGAHSKFEEAAKMRRDFEALKNEALKKEDPRAAVKALMQLGLSKEQIRQSMEQWYHEEFIEPETLNEDQRARKEAERRLKEYEARELEQKQREQQQQEEQMTAKQREYFERKIIDTLESSKLPKNPETAKRIAFYMREALKNGWDAPAEVIAAQVRKEQRDIFSQTFSNANVEEVINLVGEDFINKLRAYDLKQLRERRSMGIPSDDSQRASNDSNASGNKVSYDEVNRRIRDMRSGKWWQK